MNYKTKIKGQCHCGNLTYILHSNKDLNNFQGRRCQCSFCTSHGVNWASDPEGRLEIDIQNQDLIKKYQNKNSLSAKITELTADFYICKNCGVLTISVSNIDGNNYAVFNLNSSEYSKKFADNFINTDFEGENLEDRLARRKKNWIGEVIFNND